GHCSAVCLAKDLFGSRKSRLVGRELEARPAFVRDELVGTIERGSISRDDCRRTDAETANRRMGVKQRRDLAFVETAARENLYAVQSAFVEYDSHAFRKLRQ